MRDLIYQINHEENFEQAKGMLKLYNDMFGTNYFFINKRVCYECIENNTKTFHDVYTCIFGGILYNER